MRHCWCRTLTTLVLALQPPLLVGATQQDPVAHAKELVQAGKLKQAEAVLQAASQANPSSSGLHGLLGEVLLKEQKYEDSVQELGLAAQADPDSLPYAVLLSEALIGWQHFGVAVDYLNAIKPKFEQHAEFHYLLGLAFYSENKLKDAKPEFETALRLEPDLAQASYLLAGCLASEGDYSQAEGIFSALTKQHPSNANYWIALAQVLAKENNNVEAIRAARRALSLAPRNAHVQYVTATVLMESGNFSDAVPMFEKLERLDSSVVAVHVALARLYARQGRRELAHKEAERAQQLQESNQSQPGQKPPAQAEYPAPQ
jgi:cellulose synthase operon protein C